MDGNFSTVTDYSNYNSSEVGFTANGSSWPSSEFPKSNTISSNVSTDITTADTYTSTMSAATGVSDNKISSDSSNTRISSIASSSASVSSVVSTSPSTNFGESVSTDSADDVTTLGTSPTNSLNASTSHSTSTRVSIITSSDISTSLINTNTSFDTNTSVRNNLNVSTTVKTTIDVVSTNVDTSSSSNISVDTSPSGSSDAGLSISTTGSISTSSSMSSSSTISSSPSANTKVSTSFDSVSTKASASPSSNTKVDTSTKASASPSSNTKVDMSTKASASPSSHTKVDMSTGTKASASPSSNTKVDMSTKASGSPSSNTKVDMSTKASASPSSNTKVDMSTKASGSPSSNTKVDVSISTSFSHSATSSEIGPANATDWNSVTQPQSSISYTKGRTTGDITSPNMTTRNYFSSITSSSGATNSASVSGGLPTAVSETVSITSVYEESTGWIAAPVVCGALLLTAVIIILILVKLRRMPKCKFRRSLEKHEDGPYSSPLTISSANECARPVLVADFVAHVANLHMDIDFGFASEFEMLKEQSQQFQRTAAELPENRPKNRYTNILPFDKDRVKLAPIDDDMTGASDYINASFLPGVLSRREYIAAQGPLPGTIDDFWRMIWEYNVTTIVMVTDLVEDGKVLAAQYWPNQNEPIHYGDVRVEPKSEAVVGSYVLRIFSVSLDERSHLVKQFHLTDWKDRTSFNNVEKFLAFHGDVRRSLTNSPMLVHCSAGVGRTGTFIAVDYLLRKIEMDSSIDVFHLVLEMRSHRTNMVQTLKQYCFVHDCISYAIEHAYHKGMPVPSGNSFQELKGNSEEVLIPLSTFCSN